VNVKVVAVLVVEDDQLIEAIAEEALSDGGFEAVVTTSGRKQLGSFRRINLIIARSLPISI
jgi:DNA-binding response OmpR family regulator